MARYCILLFHCSVLLPLAGCTGRSIPAETDDSGSPAAVTVRVEPVRMACFEKVISGVGACAALPASQVPITATVEGVVKEILVEEGSKARAGQTLVVLDDRLARRELAEREAARDELAASLVLLTTPPREPERREAELEIERTQAALDLAQSVVARLEPLHQRKEVSDQQLYEAKQKVRDADLALKLAQAQKEVLLLGPKAEAVAEGEARVRRAEAAVASANERLAYFELKAPRDGLVNSVACHPGQLLAVGTVAAELVDVSEVIVTAWLPAEDLNEIHAGQTARVSVRRVEQDGRNAEGPLEGKVTFVGWQASPDTGLLPVRIRVPNAEKRLRLGISLAVEVVVAEANNGLAVPDAAIVPGEDGPTLSVVRGGKVTILRPEVGFRHNGLTQVTIKGLREGELVVTQGAYNLPDGTAVDVQQEGDGTGAAEP